MARISPFYWWTDLTFAELLILTSCVTDKPLEWLKEVVQWVTTASATTSRTCMGQTITEKRPALGQVNLLSATTFERETVAPAVIEQSWRIQEAAFERGSTDIQTLICDLEEEGPATRTMIMRDY